MAAERIRVVDDNEVNVELALVVLEAAGYVVDVALDANQALRRVAQCRPELILMDIQLPGMDGLALTRLIKADPATRDIVIVAFTAFAMQGDEARMRAAGCDGYIAKPIDVAQLPGQVRDCLRTA